MINDYETKSDIIKLYDHRKLIKTLLENTNIDFNENILLKSDDEKIYEVIDDNRCFSHDDDVINNIVTSAKYSCDVRVMDDSNTFDFQDNSILIHAEKSFTIRTFSNTIYVCHVFNKDN